MNDLETNLIVDYMIKGINIGNTNVFDAISTLTQINGNDIIEIIIENKCKLRSINTNNIPQFSNEKDVYNVLKILIDSGINNLTYEQIGSYLCPNNAKSTAKRKYGENHYKFAYQLGLTVKERPFSATEIGVAYYLMENDTERQALMNRLVFSIPIVQHSIVKASEARFSMVEYLGDFLSPSTVIRRRSNMHKIMSWAYEITTGNNKNLFDNIVWY